MDYHGWPGFLYISAWRARPADLLARISVALMWRLQTEPAQNAHSGIMDAIQFP